MGKPTAPLPEPALRLALRTARVEHRRQKVAARRSTGSLLPVPLDAATSAHQSPDVSRAHDARPGTGPVVAGRQGRRPGNAPTRVAPDLRLGCRAFCCAAHDRHLLDLGGRLRHLPLSGPPRDALLRAPGRLRPASARPGEAVADCGWAAGGNSRGIASHRADRQHRSHGVGRARHHCPDTGLHPITGGFPDDRHAAGRLRGPVLPHRRLLRGSKATSRRPQRSKPGSRRTCAATAPFTRTSQDHWGTAPSF